MEKNKDTHPSQVEMGFANLDKFRPIRTGAPEAVFCPGKTPLQIGEILAELSRMHPEENIMATRATAEDFRVASGLVPEAVYDPVARIIAVVRKISPSLTEAQNRAKAEDDNRAKGPNEYSTKTYQGIIAVVTAGTADIPVAEEAAVTAELLGNPVDRIYDVGVAGIHRLFDKLDRVRDANVIIVVAGMEAALTSVIGGLVSRPVIAVPTHIGYGSSFEGLTALLSMLNSCANGIGVVNIDNGYGAACLASKINKAK
jgi:pyridinium-3,5-biscarboxylic acid mononucleotide synthase